MNYEVKGQVFAARKVLANCKHSKYNDVNGYYDGYLFALYYTSKKHVCMYG